MSDPYVYVAFRVPINILRASPSTLGKVRLARYGTRAKVVASQLQDSFSLYLGVSKKRGPQNRLQHTTILNIRTPQKGP